MTAPLPALPPLTEKAFQAMVVDLARLRGWRVAHFRPGMNRRGQWSTAVQGDGAGFPDLIMLRGEQGLAVELKAAWGKLAPEQTAWLDAFRAAGFIAAVFRPVGWPAIERALA